MRTPFVSRREHDLEIAALRRRVLDTEARHDEVEEERRGLAKQLAAAQQDRPTEKPDIALQAEVADLRTRLARAQAEVVTLSSELGEARKTGRLIEGGTNRPRTADAELRQAHDHNRALAEKLAEMTAANQRCRCGGAT
jgi:chromosome segregation ATPase